MSVLPPEVQTDLAQLLDALQSSDNNVRSQAEEHLTNNWQATKPEMLLMGLVEQLQGASDATVRYPSPNTLQSKGIHMLTSCTLETRSFAAVLFRRIASKSRKLPNGENVELFLALPQQQAHAIRQRLLEALGAESVNSVRNEIGDAVVEIAREYSDNSAFSEVDLDATMCATSISYTKLTLSRGAMARDFRGSLHPKYLRSSWATRKCIPHLLYNS
jgi:hypothetical protein